MTVVYAVLWELFRYERYRVNEDSKEVARNPLTYLPHTYKSTKIHTNLQGYLDFPQHYADTSVLLKTAFPFF